MEKTREDIVLDLVRENKITNEQAKILLQKATEYIYPSPTIAPIIPFYPVYPYYQDYSDRVIISTITD